MAVGTLIPVEEYPRTTYRPDCDYLDGQVLERNAGEQSHGRLQARIAAWFSGREKQWRLAIKTAPLLCIEILLRDDRMNDMLARTRDYFQIGVPLCWIVDPIRREARAVSPVEIAKVSDGVLRAADIEMPLTDILEPLA